MIRKQLKNSFKTQNCVISNVANTTRKQNWTQGNHFEHKNLKEFVSKGNLLKSQSSYNF